MAASRGDYLDNVVLYRKLVREFLTGEFAKDAVEFTYYAMRFVRDPSPVFRVIDGLDPRPSSLTIKFTSNFEQRRRFRLEDYQNRSGVEHF